MAEAGDERGSMLAAFTSQENMERVLRELLSPQKLEHYAREIAEHKRDPYSLVEELVRNSG